ncbi:MAG: response regulator [Pseudomonadota bacterium]
MPLPIYHHPSLTVLIDDSDSFLRSVSFQLDPALASKCFHDTRAALEWLCRNSQTAPRQEPALSASFDAYPLSLPQCSVAFDLEQIHRISYERARFMTPSVLVVDYSMPQMNGVQLCEALAHLPCKKILFTGAADEKVAVDAFNRGLIDRYIKKSDDDALERLEAEIVALQKQYFAEQSDTLRDLLALHDYNFVSDPAIVALAAQLGERFGIVEHYLYPNPGGLLMYDADGRARLLVLETDDGMHSHLEMARDNDAPPSLLAALEERCIIPWFREGDGMYSNDFGGAWHKFCEPAQVCHGRQVYYWAVFELAPGDLPERAVAFSQFLREHQAETV